MVLRTHVATDLPQIYSIEKGCNFWLGRIGHARMV